MQTERAEETLVLTEGEETKTNFLILQKYLKTSGSNPTLFESENERQKIEPVPIPLPMASRNFPDVKTRNIIFFHNWTSEIIPFIGFGMQMNGNIISLGS